MTVPEGLLGKPGQLQPSLGPFTPTRGIRLFPQGLKQSLSASTALSLPAVMSPPFPGGGTLPTRSQSSKGMSLRMAYL